MKKSKYTFTVNKNDGLVLMNYMSGAVDKIEKDEAEEFLKRYESDNWSDYEHMVHLYKNGYLCKDETEENQNIRKKYIEFSEEYENTPVQLIFSTTYACNFSCSYCFQSDYKEDNVLLNNEIINSFFNYIEKRFNDESQRPYITLFGGEPLLNGKTYKDALLYFLKTARDKNYEIAIVTNGYTLSEYAPIFKEENIKIKEIQVTLDGDKNMHDGRRKTKTGGETFEKIAAGIDAVLKLGYRVNLRTIIDKENISKLPYLAQYCEDKGWLGYGSKYFESTVGRNYELYGCGKGANLFDRLTMWQEFIKLAEENPILKRFHKPQFHGIRYLSENKELPMPVFDACPAGKKEWAFDAKGNIYGCTASVGVEKYKLGSFLDENEPLNTDQIEQWASRDVLTIEACKNCAVSLSCGGGCGVIACNETGKILSENCRPVKELIKLGLEYYNII
ncbi:MAG: radical SAM protein [Spirochaetia bacterium]|nr:radical SAM protein [Spirochaetia bacterium]